MLIVAVLHDDDSEVSLVGSDKQTCAHVHAYRGTLFVIPSIPTVVFIALYLASSIVDK